MPRPPKFPLPEIFHSFRGMKGDFTALQKTKLYLEMDGLDSKVLGQKGKMFAGVQSAAFIPDGKGGDEQVYNGNRHPFLF
jgi:hypothetical protein